MDNKPKNYKEAALSHIPPELVSSMLKETAVSTDGMGFLEAIAKNTPKSSPLPTAGNELIPASVPPQFTTIAIDSIALKVPTDPWQASMVMIMFLLATVWSKDKKVAKVLKAFNFSLQDANGAIIYPKQKGKNK